jgi:hypothetical protein
VQGIEINLSSWLLTYWLSNVIVFSATPADAG